MRKLIAFVMAMTMVLSFAVVAYADGDTVLSTSVPDAEYTLVIPANQTIEFGATSTELGTVTVQDSSGFAKGKDLAVTVTYSPFTNSSNESTIPYSLYAISNSAYGDVTLASGKRITFSGASSGTVGGVFGIRNENNLSVPCSEIGIAIESDDWGKALAGEYSTTIHFSAEVVNS